MRHVPDNNEETTYFGYASKKAYRTESWNRSTSDRYIKYFGITKAALDYYSVQLYGKMNGTTYLLLINSSDIT
jgi:hypothetical protein